jgi:MOSC domain-containing protein YiiM
MDAGPFDELQWVGKILRIGSAARIAVTQVDKRCVMITLDPATGESSPEILKCVVQNHGQCAGIYATVLTPGEVRAGDPILLEA